VVLLTLTKGRVFSLHFLLDLASSSCPSPEGLITIFYCLKFETSPNLEGRIPVLIFFWDRVAQLYQRLMYNYSLSGRCLASGVCITIYVNIILPLISKVFEDF
jgi:hypothetical protein